MLHKKVVLAQLQIRSPQNPESKRIAGQLYNLFYAASFPWSKGNLGRVIPTLYFEEFYIEYEKLRDVFEGSTILSVLPFPNQFADNVMLLPPEILTPLLRSHIVISDSLEQRFKIRLQMIREAVLGEKRFYESLLNELKNIIDKGMYLREMITPHLLKGIQKAQSEILCYTAEDIRQSTSVKEEIIATCGAIL